MLGAVVDIVHANADDLFGVVDGGLEGHLAQCNLVRPTLNKPVFVSQAFNDKRYHNENEN